MNDRNEESKSMFLEVGTVITDHTTDWTGNAPFTASKTIFDTNNATIQTAENAASKITGGYTLDKANKDIALTKLIIESIAGIQSWGAATGNDSIAGTVNYTDTQVEKSHDTSLITKGNNVFAVIHDNKPSIVPTYLPTTKEADLTAAITAYSLVVEMPEAQRSEKKMANKNLDQGIKDQKKHLKTRMDKDAKNLGTTKPDFYTAWKAARKIKKNPTRHLAVQGLVKTSALPFLANVTLVVIETGLVINSGNKGNFQIKSLPPGSYSMLVSKFGYVTQNVPFNVNANERTNLIIIMQSNP